MLFDETLNQVNSGRLKHFRIGALSLPDALGMLDYNNVRSCSFPAQSFGQVDAFFRTLRRLVPFQNCFASNEKGTWNFYVREQQDRQQSAVAHYLGEHLTVPGNGTADPNFLFMSFPGSSPDLEGMVHNAELISSGMLGKVAAGEKSLLPAYILTLASATGMQLALSPIDGFGRLLMGGVTSFLAFMFSYGFLTTSLFEGDAGRIKAKAAEQLSNPGDYLYGGKAALVLREELAYNELRKAGQCPTLEDFKRSLSIGGFSALVRQEPYGLSLERNT